MVDRHLRERLEDPARDLVGARDPTEDVEQDRLDLRVAGDDLQRVDDALRVAAAAEVAEVRRLAAGQGDDVERRHREPGPVREDADRSVELHVGDALLARGALLGRIGLGIAHLPDVGVPEEGVVVDGELRVERLDLAGGRDDQRVDLAEHRVELDEGLVQLPDDRRDLLLLLRVLDAGAVDQPPRLPGLEALERVDVQADERVGARGRNLLDVHAALRREHEQRLLRAAVEGDREVVLLGDIGGGLDPELADDVAADVEAENLLRALLRLVRPLGELDPARLAAPAGQHLRLDDDLARRAPAPPRAPLPGSSPAGPRRPGCRRAGRAPCPGTRRDPSRGRA